LGLWLTSALGYLHKQRVIHRDIKPSNIVFIGGVPKLADAGLAAELRTDLSLVGSPRYMPPEFRWTAQGDIYSLGRVLYEASTGNDPKDFADSPVNLAGDDNEKLQQGLATIISHACKQDPLERYQSAQEMHHDLELLQQGHSPRPLKKSLLKWKFWERS
jgi:serine/threonine protein kinase